MRSYNQDTSPEALDSYYARIFGLDVEDPSFFYNDWAGSVGELE
jgi:hypothetical protein